MKNYEQILNLEHFHQTGRPFMSNRDRAAQFMPFKSLAGFEEKIEEEELSQLLNEERIIDFSDSQEIEDS